MPRPNFDPYADLTPEEKTALKRPPGGGVRQFPQHRVEGGKILRGDSTREIPLEHCKMRCKQLSSRVRELDRQIERLQQERKAHLDQAAALDEIVKQAGG